MDLVQEDFALMVVLDQNYSAWGAVPDQASLALVVHRTPMKFAKAAVVVAGRHKLEAQLSAEHLWEAGQLQN